MILLWTLFGLIILFYIMELYKRTLNKVPPGPWPMPFIGNLHQIMMAHSRPDLALAKLSKTYGEIYRIKVGLKETVILSSFESIISVLSRKEALGRDLSGTIFDRNQGKNDGMVFSEGPKWEKMRAWTVKNLRDYGFNKTLSMEASISEDVKTLLDEIDEVINSSGGRSGIFDIVDMFVVPVFKFPWRLIVGKWTPEDILMLKPMIKKSEIMVKNTLAGAGLINAFPFLRLIFPVWTSHNIIMEFFNECYRISRQLLREAGAHPIEAPTSFIEAYAKKMKQVGTEADDCFDEHNFSVLFMDIFQASSNTTNSYLKSLVLFMILYPDMQERVYQELRDSVPPGQRLVFSDLKSMKYTQSVMLETHRHTKVVPNFVPRKATQDFEYKNYVILKGTVIMTDLHTVFNNKITWGDPEVFRPDRFLCKVGNLINKEHMIQFSVGKRNCPGEHLAEVSSFLFFASLVQNYKLSVVPGQPAPRQDMSVGFTSQPFPFKVSISKRLP